MHALAYSWGVGWSDDCEFDQRSVFDPSGQDVFCFGALVAPCFGEYAIEHIGAFVRIGYLFRLGCNVCVETALEVDCEFGVGFHVRQPVTFTSWHAGYVEAAIQVDEVDFDPSWLAGLRPECRDINHSATVKRVPD